MSTGIGKVRPSPTPKPVASSSASSKASKPAETGHSKVDLFTPAKANAADEKNPLKAAFQRGLEAGKADGLAGKPPNPPEGGSFPQSALEKAGYAAGYPLGHAKLEGTLQGIAAAREGKPLFTDQQRPGESDAVFKARQDGINEGYALGLKETKAKQEGFLMGIASARDGKPGPDVVNGPADTDLEKSARLAAAEAGFAFERKNLEEQKKTEAAIAFATNPPSVDGGWYGKCLSLVRQAEEAAQGRTIEGLHSENAIGSYNNYKNQVHTDSNPPRGALVFFSYGDDGHIGISLGDGNFIGTTPAGTGVRPLDYNGTYLGWAYP